MSFNSDISAFEGSSDFFGLNHYTTKLVSPIERTHENESEFHLVWTKEEADPSWKQ